MRATCRRPSTSAPATTSAVRDASPVGSKYAVDVINRGIDKRLKVYNVCCSQGGCK